MTTVVVKCDTHGLYEIPICVVSLHLCRDGAGRSYYQFPCAICGLVQRPATLWAVTELMGAGVTPRYWSLPAEARETHTGPALGEDDLIRFGLDLATWDEVTV